MKRGAVAAGGSSSGSFDNPESILVIKPSSFGDIVHTLPAVARLKTAWPKAKISWVVNSEWSPLLSENKCVDEVVSFPRQNFRGWAGPVRFRRWCLDQLTNQKPDLAVDFQGLLRSAWLVHESRPFRSVGMRDAREGARWFYDYSAPMPTGKPHAVERYLATSERALRIYGLHPESWSNLDPLFPLPAGEPPEEATVEIPDRFILLHPFARGQGKSLTEEQVQRLCRDLAPHRVVLVGRRTAPLPALPENCIDLLNRTSLKQLIWLIRRAMAVITVDSGPSHLAAALQRPMIAIHTWSDPRRVGPYWPHAWVWKNGTLLQMKQMSGLADEFFARPPRDLSTDDLSAIARSATSFSDSSA